jgi:peptidyl-prolyl cis-trans isomerase A (cyclophilin A)
MVPSTMLRPLAISLVALIFAVGACTGKQPQQKPHTAETPTKSAPAGDSAADPDADGEPVAAHPALLDPSKANETAPDTYKVAFTTTKGDFVIEVDRTWAPKGADRFYNLVKIGFFDGVGFFRAIKGFMVQFGIHGNPEVTQAWKPTKIEDDPVQQSNEKGFITFATSGPNTRTTQVFINYGNNANLDGMGFAPFGKVVEGMDVVESLYTGYGEGAPRGMGPNQGSLENNGTKYLESQFPKLDYVKTATIM